MTFLHAHSPYAEPGFDEWRERLDSLPPSEVWIRPAEPTVEDGRWMRWVQAECEIGRR